MSIVERTTSEHRFNYAKDCHAEEMQSAAHCKAQIGNIKLVEMCFCVQIKNAVTCAVRK